MADATAIEWADSTFNPWIGCTKISPACDHCYASVSTPARSLGVEWGAGHPRRRTSESNWKVPVRWNARPFYECAACGWRGDDPDGACCPRCRSLDGTLRAARRRVFCASLADVFDNEVDPQWRDELFALINATPNLDWLLLTKRIGNVPMMVSVIRGWLPQNVWLGVTVANQAEADRDIPKLLKLPAIVRFLSMEPLLGPVDLRLALFGHCPEHDFPGGFCVQRRHPGLRHIDWVIVGGESGQCARPMNPQWVRDLRDQCATAGVPFLFKQWGGWVSVSEVEGPGAHHTFEDGRTVRRTGKRAAGRTLDGVEHTAFPEHCYG